MKNKFVKLILKVLQITLGTTIYAIGTSFFIDPHNLAPGGVTGVAIILNRATHGGISVGLFVLIVNVPLLIAGLIKFGREFLLGTVYGTLMLSLEIYAFEALRSNLIASGDTWFIVENPIISGLTGGTLMAVGLGVVFKAGATSGGTDIIVKFLRLKYRHMRTGKIFLITDTIIALSSLPVVGWQIETVLYSMLALITSGLVLDVVLYGTDGAKLVYIVSDKTAEIAIRILKELDTGATFLDGEGAYTMEKKEVLMCVVKKHMFPKLKDIVTQEDSRAFLIVSSANEVFGEGYKDHFREDM